MEFFQSQMGYEFYQGTMPRIAESLERIANSLEKFDAQKIHEGIEGLDIELTNIRDVLENLKD